MGAMLAELEASFTTAQSLQHEPVITRRGSGSIPFKLIENNSWTSAEASENEESGDQRQEIPQFGRN